MSRTRKVFATALATAGAVGATLAGTASPAAAQAVPCVQQIAVINNGAYAASFTVTTRAGITTTPTDTYTINNFRVIDLTNTPIPVGQDVRPVVSAQAGNTRPADQFVSFCANGQTATYSAGGTTTDLTVNLLQ